MDVYTIWNGTRPTGADDMLDVAFSVTELREAAYAIFGPCVLVHVHYSGGFNVVRDGAVVAVVTRDL